MKTKLAGMGGAPAQTFVDDVFSTWLYTGNGATQTITNGIDLAGKGGLVWIKNRAIPGQSNADAHQLYDTTRGLYKTLHTNSTSAQETTPADTVTSFNSTGFSLGADTGYWGVNEPTYTFVSWTFRKAAKFFDVVTWTGNGVNGRAISHNLGIAPGMIIVKSTSNASNWVVYHQSLSLPTNKTLRLNTTSAELTGGYFPTLPTSSVFYTNGDGYEVNTTGQTYVAYLFAHDTSSTGIIQCGSFTTDGSGNATVNLGWEPQWLMQKSTGTGRWEIEDTMRGWNRSFVAELMPNLSNAEESANGAYFTPTATGFTTIGSGLLLPSVTYIYMAIRRPNKPPTTGTQVFSPISSSAATGTALTTNFPVDLQVIGWQQGVLGKFFSDRLRGVNTIASNNSPIVDSTSTAAESSAINYTLNWNNTGFQMPGYYGWGTTSVFWNFKRAPGFFDVVCYTGFPYAQTQAHNLGAVPELMIVKPRSSIYLSPSDWQVYVGTLGNTSKLVLNTTDAAQLSYLWNSTSPTTSVFSISNSAFVNQSGATYVAYLFATLAGIQYINSYVGDGTTGRVINCGFSAGARFICIKATSTTGSWWVWDSARGITSANDPALQLNSTAAEITSADAIDPSSSGFIVNQEATCSINASGVSYLVWAIA